MAYHMDPVSDCSGGHQHSERRSRREKPSRSGRGAAIAALWLLTTALYFVLSFATGAWHLTWILFLIAGAATGLVSAIYDWKK